MPMLNFEEDIRLNAISRGEAPKKVFVTIETGDDLTIETAVVTHWEHLYGAAG